MFNFMLCSFIILLQFDNAFSSPVLLWGTQTPTKSSFPPVRLTEFATIVRPLLKDHMLVAFIEDNLSTRDFLCFLPYTKQPCYTYLRLAHPKTYYSSVRSPIIALKSLEAPMKWQNINSTGQLDEPINCEIGSIKFVTFGVNLNKRYQILNTHDTLMKIFTKKLNCSTVYLYMSNESSIAQESVIQKRIRRDTVNSTASNLVVGYRCALYTSKITVTNKQKSTSFGVANIQDLETEKFLDVVLTTTNGEVISFEVHFSGNFYIVRSFNYSNITFYTIEVEAPFEFSFYCGDLSMTHKDTTLVFKNFQFQLFVLDQHNLTKFTQPWHCVGFFSAPIVSGLFVVAILISITSCGICWIMDIHSNDCFDNPRGKAITFGKAD